MNIKLIIKNVRCFSEEQHFDIRPLTFLVGENSTGKTTVMSCFNVIGNLINNRSRHFLNVPDFNREPYYMGSFQDIITKKSGVVSNKNIQKATFEIGCELDESNYKYKIHFMKREKGVEPVIQKANINFKDIIFDFNNKEVTIKIKDKKKIDRAGKNVIQTSLKIPGNRFIYDFIEEPYLLRHLVRRNMADKKNLQKKVTSKTIPKHQKEILEKIEKRLEDIEYGFNFFHNNIISLAPIRSKPKRTYDPIREIPDPEGSEIPMILMRLSGEEKDWKQLREKLINFGKTSGLFSDVKVKKYGKSIGEPFQLQLQVRGFQSNIMDIGYGVSQILPLLVHLFYPKQKSFRRDLFLLNSFESRLLLQQPEVHLHPKAQAELASLLIESIKANNSFLIETHSDYMIDRARIEIRKKSISHRDVSLIYLEPIKKGVKAHNISFDEQGNLIKAPKGYRDFFIKESNRFLGFEN